MPITRLETMRRLKACASHKMVTGTVWSPKYKHGGVARFRPAPVSQGCPKGTSAERPHLLPPYTRPRGHMDTRMKSGNYS